MVAGTDKGENSFEMLMTKLRQKAQRPGMITRSRRESSQSTWSGFEHVIDSVFTAILILQEDWTFPVRLRALLLLDRERARKWRIYI